MNKFLSILKGMALKIVFILIASLLVFGTYASVIAVRKFAVQLDQIELGAEENQWLANYVYQEYLKIPDEHLDKSQIRAKVQGIIKPVLYQEEEVNGFPNQYTTGLCSIGLRIIWIKKGLNSFQYAATLAHEYTHLQFLMQNEAMTDYTSIKLLYDSGDTFLQKVALYKTYEKVTLPKSLRNSESFKPYYCSYQLYEYFKEKAGV